MCVIPIPRQRQTRKPSINVAFSCSNSSSALSFASEVFFFFKCVLFYHNGLGRMVNCYARMYQLRRHYKTTLQQGRRRNNVFCFFLLGCCSAGDVDGRRAVGGRNSTAMADVKNKCQSLKAMKKKKIETHGGVWRKRKLGQSVVRNIVQHQVLDCYGLPLRRIYNGT